MRGPGKYQLQRLLDRIRGVPSPQSSVTGYVDPSKEQVYEAAKIYLECGLSLIPISPRGTKKPAYELLARGWWPARNKYRWPRRRYEKVIPTLEEVRGWFLESDSEIHYGIGIVSGNVSGGLEILDFDNIERIEPWSNLVDQDAPGLLERLIWVQTPRPGIHLYYRCSTCECSQKLALVPDSEKAHHRPRCEIETKGEKGYVVAPPSPARCHPNCSGYSFLGQKNFTAIQSITTEERQVLLKHARHFNHWKEPKRVFFGGVRAGM